MKNLMSLSRLTLLFACLLALQGCFENSGDKDKDKDRSKASVQMSQPESRDK
ncbi:hypothetical protein I9018_15070 [Pseudomonas sp. MPFS]|uniref:hypothetical protein n=1 Tax=Pseudomonas sp. MPFS TaxID=2795724 RepID=UPI001F13E6C3|nr:hypothetical protein [Pseudomonas sp. MPFS]UMZ15431.1 hypothetical protein I9018_15070 [Pseudomonas sp. MPFS]